MKKIPKFNQEALGEISIILGDAVTGTQLTNIFNSTTITDCSNESTKWKRIFYSLREKQENDKCGNHIISFIHAVMNPIRFDESDKFESHRTKLNTKLLHIGLELRSTGKLAYVKVAKTIPEAIKRANNLRQKLIDRGIHHDVLKFCKAEFLEENYFHCVFEASKSVAQKIRDKTGLIGDGSSIVDTAFSIKNPILALNSLTTESEQSDQKGYANLLRGIFGTFRNVIAHEPRIFWAIDEAEALDALTIISYAHRRLDDIIVIPNNPLP